MIRFPSPKKRRGRVGGKRVRGKITGGKGRRQRRLGSSEATAGASRRGALKRESTISEKQNGIKYERRKDWERRPGGG